MREIPLSKEHVALVDDEDYERLSRWRWFWIPSRPSHSGYAIRHLPRPKRGSVYMHREIMNAPTGIDVHHVNNDGLDNQRTNLRLATRGQNLAARDAVNPYRGVRAVNRRWRAQATVNRKNVYLGYFNSPEEAARAYDAFALATWGEFARLNFQPS